MVTVEIGKLERNARRRAYRWIARQPEGEDHPIIHYRLGNWWRAEECHSDFLDIVVPGAAISRDWQSPYAYATILVEQMCEAIRCPADGRLPTVACSHNERYGARRVYVNESGRLATRADWQASRD